MSLLSPFFFISIRSTNWIASYHRGTGQLIAKGADLNAFLWECQGRQGGDFKGRGDKMHRGGTWPLVSSVILAPTVARRRRLLARRPGKDLTIVTCGGMVLKADAAAEQLKQKGIDIEIVDLRSLAPLDKETILNSVAKTKRAIVLDEGPMIGGISAELAALIQENLLPT